MEDMVQVMSFAVTVSIPTVAIVDGEREEMSEAEVQKKAEALKGELEELNFGELVKATGQGIAEEQFLAFKPIVDVTVGG